jgi:hypothetical protein
MTATETELSRLVVSGRNAVDRVGADRTAFTLAGRTIRLEGAGSALISRIAPAFCHLPHVSDDAPADLTVLLWDTASTGQPLPDLGPFRAVTGSPVTPILHGSGRSFIFHAFENAMSYLDHEERMGVYVVEDASALPPWERACPLRTLLTWWLASHDLLLAHGAAVGSPDGAVVLAGPGGSGKSTAALACLAAGMGYLGDDYVLLDPRSHSVWSVYCSAKLAEDHLMRFPGLMQAEAAQCADPADAKRIGWPAAVRPSVMVLSAPVRAMIVPVVQPDAPCTVTPVPASRALMAVAPLTMFQTAGDQRTAFRLVTEFVRDMPTFRLELGLGMERVPGLLQSIIEQRMART